MSAFSMTFKVDGEVLLGFPVGRIDSTNAKIFENDINLIKNKYPKAEMSFDCSNLEYISSAGLRVLLSVSKRTPIKLQLTNVTQEVYDILNVTGFSSIFDVSRPIRDISSTEGKFMGMSNGISLYRMDDDTILKVYPTWEKLEDVKMELKRTKAALLSGVPALISYDIVKYNGRYGISYEMPNVKTVSSLIVFQQWKLEQYADEMGKTLRMIHSCRPETGIMPRTSEMFTEYALKLDKYFDQKEIHDIILMINAIPSSDSFVYGSYHPGDVFVMNDELILINMSGISCGNPVFDLGISYMICVLEGSWFLKYVTDLDTNQGKKLWDIMIRSYFETKDDEVIKSKENIIAVVALLCSALLPVMNMANLTHDDLEKLIAKVRNNLLSNAKALTLILRDAKF